jgi:transcriptional regulator with XRE-family HTH domain
MNERSEVIYKLKNNRKTREAYIKAKLNINIPSQIRALRLQKPWMQEELGKEVDMKQSRISKMEQPGAVNFNLATLVRLAAAFRVGLVVRFASFSEMLNWENEFSQDIFNVTKLDDDIEFVTPVASKQVEEEKGRESACLGAGNEPEKILGPWKMCLAGKGSPHKPEAALEMAMGAKNAAIGNYIGANVGMGRAFGTDPQGQGFLPQSDARSHTAL